MQTDTDKQKCLEVKSSFTSNPWRRPTFIMSLQRFGTTHITSTAFYSPTPDQQKCKETKWKTRPANMNAHHITSSSVVSNPAFLEILKRSCERVKMYYSHICIYKRKITFPWLESKKDASRLTFRSNWYFIIRWTGLISRSVICNLWPNRCFRSWWKIKVSVSLQYMEIIV